MVAAVYYFATERDQHALLDYLGEPAAATLHPWPLVRSPLEVLSRAEALGRDQVMVAHSAMAVPVAIRPGDPAMQDGTKAGLFNRINWGLLHPEARDEALVDSNASPVLFWQPGRALEGQLLTSHIGSQADAMTAISPQYERWVKRTMDWVRRRGERVWGLDRTDAFSGLDIQLDFVNNVYALPGALVELKEGAPGRSDP